MSDYVRSCLKSISLHLAWFVTMAHGQELLDSGSSVDGNKSISIQVEGDPLTITTTSRLAGAVHSIRWKGKEFIDSADHGRQLQSACSFDAMSDEPFWAERYNPTEAGSRRDGAGDRSTSRLLGIEADDKLLRTSTQMAYWLNPGERSEGRLALNETACSDHILHKRIELGAYGDPHIIRVDNTFEWPQRQKHRFAQFEVLTGYMPSEFSDFWKVSSQDGRLLRLDDGPGEQPDPVILATPGGEFAMGAIAVGHSDWIVSKPGYGRFRFKAERVVKWNVVFRHRELPGLSNRKASFRVLVIVGSRDLVARLIRQAIRLGDSLN